MLWSLIVGRVVRNVSLVLSAILGGKIASQVVVWSGVELPYTLIIR